MIKKTLTFAVLILLFIFLTGYGQETGLRGRVVDNDKKPVQGAVVKLITLKESQTTDGSGNFFFQMKTSTLTIPASPILTAISFRNGIFSFNVSGNQRKIRIEVFDKKGQRVNKVIKEGIGEGTYHINILPDNLPVMMYVVKLQIGSSSGVYKVINLTNRTSTLQGSGLRPEKSLLKRSAGGSKPIDTLEAGKDGYQTARTTILSYMTSLPDIVLKSNASDTAGLPPVVSDIPGNREWVESGSNGLLYADGATASLRAALADLGGDAARRSAMGVRSRNIVAARADWSKNRLVLDVLCRTATRAAANRRHVPSTS